MNRNVDPTKDAYGGAASQRRARAFSVPQLLSLLTIVTLAPLVLFGAAALHLWDKRERQADVARLEAHAASLSQAVDREIRGFRETLEGMVNSPELKAGQVDVFSTYAREVANRVGGHFALIDPVMRQLMNTSAPQGSELPPARATSAIKRVLATKQTLVTNYEPRPVSGQTQFTILAPVINDGNVISIFGYAPPPDSIQTIVMQTYRPDGWRAAVLDRNGTIVARSEAFNEFFGRPATPGFMERIRASTGVIESTDLQGHVSMTAWHTSSVGWKIIVWAPTEVLQQRTRLAVRALALAALGALFISLLASWFASRLIRGPAQRLVEAAHSLGEGQIVHFAPTRMKEANAIGASLSEASDLIHRREADLRTSQAHTNLVMRELSHRSKNLLAMVQAMARQSARSSSSFAEFQPRFIERLQSLSMSHDLLVKTDWTSVPMRTLIAEQLRAFIDQPADRLTLTGEHLMLKPEAAQNLGMVFHELGSNAVKHGSLSVPGGRVHIDWRFEGDEAPTLVLRWSETGGPPVRPPTSRGFGTTIIEKLIPQSLQGEAKMSWEESGFEWTLRAPVSAITRSGPYAGGNPAR
ncbi:MAG: sensor histidine kinase [Beijerinckiaceae bacterium]